MIALLTIAGALLVAPPAVLARYATALETLVEPRTFTAEYTLEQTGIRTLDQTHRIFRRGADERDEIIAVNGTRATSPTIRIFRRRPFRYTVARLAPRPAQYVFTYVGPRRNGRHTDYVFSLTPAVPSTAFRFTGVAIDGVTFLPSMVSFASGRNATGSVSFAKSDKYWVPSGANATAHVRGGMAHDRLTFAHWRFPKTLPPSTFAIPRPLPSLPPAPLPG